MGSGIQKKIRETNKTSNGMLERLTNAESNIKSIYETDQKNFTVIEQRFAEQSEILDALITLTGMEQVFEQIKTKRIEKAEVEAEGKKAALEKALQEGQIVVAETVGEQSILVGTEVDKDGNQLHPIRAQLLFAQIKKDLAEPLRGKKVGEVIDTPVGSKFTLQEIYDIVIPTKAENVPVVEATADAVPPAEPLTVEAQQALVEDLSAADGTVN
jgi:hypothetical protein